MKFYLAREGVAFGPYTEFQVRESVRLGIFDPYDLALATDGKEWLEVSKLLLLDAAPTPETSKHEPTVAMVKDIRSRSHTRSHPALVAIPFAMACCILAVWAFLRQQPPPSSLPAEMPPAHLRIAATITTNRPKLDTLPKPSRAVTQAALIIIPPPIAPDSATASSVADSAPIIAEDPNEVSAASGRLIEGQIFISSGNGLKYEPSSVEVRLYPLALLKPYLEKRGSEANAKFEEIKTSINAAEAAKERMRKEADAAFDAYAMAEAHAPNRHALEQANADAKKAREKAANAYYDLLQERQDLLSGAFYLEALPEAANLTRTDRQGRFRFEVPADGEFALVAGAQRDLSGTTERFYWFIPVSVEGEPKKTVMLTNHNVSSHGSVDSLVQTAD